MVSGPPGSNLLLTAVQKSWRMVLDAVERLFVKDLTWRTGLKSLKLDIS